MHYSLENDAETWARVRTLQISVYNPRTELQFCQVVWLLNQAAEQ